MRMEKGVVCSNKCKNGKQEKERNVQVYVRVRPVNENERLAKSYAVVSCTPKEVIVKERPIEKHTKTFCFDRVFGPDSKQVDVYKTVVQPLIDEVLAGYNCTVFAYGQTGTGKTFTMEGERTSDNSISWENDPLCGIIPRAMSHLFDELRLIPAEYTVRVSFLELYNEELFDLLSPTDDTTKLRLFEDTTRKGSVIIQGLEEVTVHNKHEVYKIMEKGSLKRITAATLMNAQSSRSHTVFSITVHIKDNNVDGEELLKTGKLNLVDLAGSENIGRSGAVDKRAREAGNINQSLLTLGRVITSLVEHTPHVPYRESKLTRLLQDSLGGRTKTSIIATISPALSNLEETLSTLDYAYRAKYITNKPEINQKLTKRALLKEYTEEIERLRRDLEATREKSGVYVANENYSHMLQKLEEQENEIMEKISTIKAIKEEMDKKEELLNELDMKLGKTKSILHKTLNERDESKHLITKHVEVEKKLTNQALELQAAVSKSVDTVEKLHQKLENKENVQEMNRLATTKFVSDFETKNNELASKISDFDKKRIEFFERQQILFNDNLKKQEELFAMIRQSLSELDKLELELESGIEKSKAINMHSQKILSTHMENAKSLVFSNRSELEKLSNFRNILNSIIDYMDPIEQNLSQMKNHMIKNDDVLAELSGEIEVLGTHLREIHVHSQNISNYYSEKLDYLKQKEEILKTTNTLHSNSVNERIATFEENMKNALEECMRKMFHETKEIKDMVLNDEEINKHHNDFTTVISEITDEVNSNKEYTNNRITELADGLESCHQKLLMFKSNIKNCTQDTFQMSEDNFKKLKLVNGNAKDTLQHMLNVQSISTNKFEEEASSNCDMLSYTLNDHIKEQVQNSEGVIAKLQTKVSELEGTLHTAVCNQETFIPSQCDEFKIQCEQINEQIASIESIINQQHEIVQNYAKHDLRYDLSTGETPPRQKLQYPQCLATMSPYDRIIHNYWETRHRNSNSNLIDADVSADILSDSGNLNDVSPESSVSQYESSTDIIMDIDRCKNFSEDENKENICRSLSLIDINDSDLSVETTTNSVNSEGCINKETRKQNTLRTKKNNNVFKKPSQLKKRKV